MMRDPARIERICDELKQIWENVPDWRLGQLIVNILGRDPFYIEDEMIEEEFKKIISAMEKANNK